MKTSFRKDSPRSVLLFSQIIEPAIKILTNFLKYSIRFLIVDMAVRTVGEIQRDAQIIATLKAIEKNQEEIIQLLKKLVSENGEED